MNMRDNSQKLIAVLSFACLAAAMLIAHAHPATGYELDIYASTPIAVWVLIIFGFLGGAGIILIQVTSKDNEINKTWLIGFVLIIFSRMALLYIPYIRDYISWRGDNFEYLGMIKEILSTGHFSANDFYPITHVFLSSVVNITGFSDLTVATLSTAFISVLFIFFTYLFVGTITHDKRKQMLSVVIAGAIMLADGYNVILSPNGWSILFMPLLFFLYFKSQDGRYRLLLLIFLVIYPFFHPLSSLIVVIALLILELTRRLFSRFWSGSPTRPSLPSSSYLYVVIEFIIFSAWILSHERFHSNINLFWHQIISLISSGKLIQLGESLSKLDIQGFDFFILISKIYGSGIILIILSGIGVLWLLRKSHSINTLENRQDYLSLACVFIFCGLFYGAYLIGFPGIGTLAEGQFDRRILGYVEILIPLFVVIPLYVLLLATKFRVFVRIGIASIIILSSVLSILSLYNSPFVSQPNSQITSMDITGIQWYIERKDPDVRSAKILSPPGNIASGIMGFNEVNNRLDIRNSIQLPDHFGYPEEIRLGTQYSTDNYITLSTLDRTVYSTVWEKVGRFNTSDFHALELDTTVSKLYSNGGIDIYYVNSPISP